MPLIPRRIRRKMSIFGCESERINLLKIYLPPRCLPTSGRLTLTRVHHQRWPSEPYTCLWSPRVYKKYKSETHTRDHDSPTALFIFSFKSRDSLTGIREPVKIKRRVLTFHLSDVYKQDFAPFLAHYAPTAQGIAATGKQII